MSFEWIDFPDGRARVSGMVRGIDDGGHDIFEIQLRTYPGLYGEMRPMWADNGNDYDIEIVNFGYIDRHNVGNPDAGARRHFSTLESQALERMITSLFNDSKAQESLPFFRGRAHFMGAIHFAPGWLLESSTVTEMR